MALVSIFTHLRGRRVLLGGRNWIELRQNIWAGTTNRTPSTQIPDHETSTAF